VRCRRGWPHGASDALPARPVPGQPLERSYDLQVIVRDNNVEQALRVLKKKMQREGVFREMRARRAYEKPSEKRNRQAAEGVRRQRKLARKQAQREGLLPRKTRGR
jgi:small subunit ribosomal protein S21